MTFEEEWQGGDALWIEAVTYRNGELGEHVVFIQPYRKKLLGGAKAIGSPVAGPTADDG